MTTANLLLFLMVIIVVAFAIFPNIKLLFKGDKRQKESTENLRTEVSSPPPIAENEISAPEPDAWELQSPSGGDPYIKILRIDGISQAKKRTDRHESLPEKVNTYLGEILRTVPEIASSLPGENHYEVVFSAETMRGLQNGTFQLTYSANAGWLPIARDAKGRFVEIAHIGKQINGAVMAGTVWKIMAYVTRQKFLVDIDKHLNNIENGIAKILDWLTSEQKGVLLAIQDYLKQKASEFDTMNPEDITAVRQKTEDIELKCLEITNASFLRIDTLSDEVKQKRNLSSEDYEKKLTEYRSYANAVMFALELRTMSIHLKHALDADQNSSKNRMDDSEKRLKKLSEKTRHFFDLLEQHRPKPSRLASKWKKESILNNITTKHDNVNDEIDKQFKNVRLNLFNTEQFLSIQTNGAIRIELELGDNSKVKTAYRIIE